MQLIKRKLFAYQNTNLQTQDINSSSQNKGIFQTEVKTSNFKTFHQSKSQFSKRSSHHQNFLFRKFQHPLTQSKTSKTNLKRASTLKCRQKENDEFLIRTTNQNGFRGKIKNYYDDKVDTKDDNFLTPSQFINTKDSKMKRSLHKIGVHSSAITTPTNQITLQSKWLKTIELYTMRDQLAKKFHYTSISQLKKKYPILPSGQFYRIIIKDRVFQKDWKINFPQTIFLDTQANIVMVYTDPQTGILKKKFIEKQGKQKDRYKEQVLKFKTDFIDSLNKANKMRLFKDLRLQSNPNAPLSIMKYTENDSFQFQTDVQSDRNFNQRKLRPTRDSIVQKYIYSNNLKAMVFRLYYRKQSHANPSVPQYEGIRFQNQKPIFKESGQTNFAQIHKLTSTITLSQKRINTIKVMRINNMKALEKFILITKEVQKMLQYVEKVVIDKLYVDFIVDVFDKPWVINIKYCQVNPNSLNSSQQPKEDHIRNVSSCRLCGIVQRKQKLKNTVSVRMLCQFIYHLKKRTRQQDIHKIDFIQNVNINSKENKTSNVCKICYNVIINELQLMRMQRQLAGICNIVGQSGQQLMQGENNRGKASNNLGQYKQWRLMLYFENIKNSHQLSNYYGRPKQFNDTPYQQKPTPKGQSQYYLRYELCPKITQSFQCHKQSRISNNLNINRVKLHYFYSQTTNIEEFINNTQIIVSLYSLEESQLTNKPQKTNDLKYIPTDLHHQRKDNEKFDKFNTTEKLIASGSTHILSTFNLYKSSSFSLKALMENGQKQTATVLLFFQNKKYCELTLKVGLVYDGSYNVSNIPSKRQNSGEMENFIKWNEVWFSKNRWNSNPLPKEWMEIFGSKYNYNSGLGQSHEDIKQEQNQQRMIKKMIENQTSSLEDQFDL